MPATWYDAVAFSADEAAARSSSAVGARAVVAVGVAPQPSAVAAAPSASESPNRLLRGAGGEGSRS
jgi:hypothetical protein